MDGGRASPTPPPSDTGSRSSQFGVRPLLEQRKPAVATTCLKHAARVRSRAQVDAHLHHPIAKYLAVPGFLVLDPRHRSIDTSIEAPDPLAARDRTHESEKIGIVGEEQ